MADAVDAADTPLWHFAVAVYASPGVADACLALQSRHGLDVNLLLACCWAGQTGIALARADVADLMTRVAGWQREVVQPLRAVRGWLKTQAEAPGQPAEDLRIRVKTDELTGERIEQAILYTALADGTHGVRAEAGARAAATNLNAYFAACSLEPGVADAADLAQLLTATFGDSLRPLDAIWRMQPGDDALPA